MNDLLPKPHLLSLVLAASLTFVACSHTHEHEDSEEHDDAWAVTAWGEHFEIFTETDPLIAGETVTSHTHVTLLGDFSPMREGTVSIVLRDGSSEKVFTEEAPIRDGIYSVSMTPERAGEFEILYRVDAPSGFEEIAGGRVLVTGPEEGGGGVVEVPATSALAAEAGGSEAPISFLKEQQWRTAFATEWIIESSLSEALRAPGRTLPVAGGEVLLTAPVDGVVGRKGWPFVGLDVAAGEAVFEIVPRIGTSKSLAELDASASGLESELEVARERRVRLEELLQLGAASQAEVERARSRERVLEGQAEASRRDLVTAQATRRGDEGGEAQRVSITAPFSGRVAEVLVTPGQTVQAGEPMASVVRARPIWIEARLTPEEAGRLPETLGGLVVTGLAAGGSEGAEMTLDATRARLVSVAPSVDGKTGTVRTLLEVDASVDELRLGVAVEVEILLDEEIPGIVVPSTAVVDDSGVDVVYVQLDGEGFARLEVDVLGRRSGEVLIEGLPLDARLVTVGGIAIRRATLVATDAGEGHIH